jgi:hypothetical protein
MLIHSAKIHGWRFLSLLIDKDTLLDKWPRGYCLRHRLATYHILPRSSWVTQGPYSIVIWYGDEWICSLCNSKITHDCFVAYITLICMTVYVYCYFQTMRPMLLLWKDRISIKVLSYKLLSRSHFNIKMIRMDWDLFDTHIRMKYVPPFFNTHVRIHVDWFMMPVVSLLRYENVAVLYLLAREVQVPKLKATDSTSQCELSAIQLRPDFHLIIWAGGEEDITLKFIIMWAYMGE